MKFADLPKFVLLSTLVNVLTLALVGCGGTTGSNANLVLTQGNWSVKADSSAGNETSYIGGNLTQSGSSVSARFHVVGSCFDPSQPLIFTGTVKGNQVTLTSTSVNIGDSLITVSATGTSPSALSGTYTVSAGNNCSSDQGTITANLVPSISGTWNAPITNDAYGDSNAALSIALTQASAASADGTFALTGTVTYTGSSCSLTGTITSGSLAGSYIVVPLNANTTETDASDGSFTYMYPLLDSATNPKNMTGDYNVVNGLCQNDDQALTLTKQ